MQTFVVKDGIVQNIIEINGMSREEYERLEQCKLVDADLPYIVTMGDTYDDETGLFYRDGVRVDTMHVRDMRDYMLRSSDFAMMSDYPCSETERAGWLAYRQALRDITEQEGYPESIVWPERPEENFGNETLLSIIAAQSAMIDELSVVCADLQYELILTQNN